MPGSDQKINYQVRPAKSVERRMLCDLVRKIQLVEGCSELRYIGLGAKYFTDFLLLHNEFAISDMISIEAEKERQIRYEFNKPLKCIEMRYGSTNEILPQITDFDKKCNLVWLDYDDAFKQEMMTDIETLCRNLEIGSMFFVSCNYSYRGEVPSEKRESFKDSVGEYFNENMNQKWFAAKKIPLVIREIINNLIKEVLDKRNRLLGMEKYKYLQLLFLTYKDGAPMLTIGGIIVDDALQEILESSDMFNQYVFLSRDDQRFNIDVPKLTNKEIQLILKKIPVTKEEYESKVDEFFGIEFDEIEKFEKIYRYYPYYSEGYFAT